MATHPGCSVLNIPFANPDILDFDLGYHVIDTPGLGQASGNQKSITGESSKDLREATPAGEREDCVKRMAMPIYKGRSATGQVQQNWDFDDLIHVLFMTPTFLLTIEIFSPRS